MHRLLFVFEGKLSLSPLEARSSSVRRYSPRRAGSAAAPRCTVSSLFCARPIAWSRAARFMRSPIERSFCRAGGFSAVYHPLWGWERRRAPLSLSVGQTDGERARRAAERAGSRARVGRAAELSPTAARVGLYLTILPYRERVALFAPLSA